MSAIVNVKLDLNFIIDCASVTFTHFISHLRKIPAMTLFFKCGVRTLLLGHVTAVAAQ